MQSWVQSAGQNDTFAFNFTLGICTRAYTGTPAIHTNMSTHDKQPAYSFTYAFTNNHGACVAARECAKRCHKRGYLRHVAPLFLSPLAFAGCVGCIVWNGGPQKEHIQLT